MNWDQIEGKWETFKGQVRERWGKLTDDDMQTIKGKRGQLEGRLQERYGYARDRARDEVDNFMNSVSEGRRDQFNDTRPGM